MKKSVPTQDYDTSFQSAGSDETILFCPAVHKFAAKQIHYINDLRTGSGFYQKIDLQNAARQFKVSFEEKQELLKIDASKHLYGFNSPDWPRYCLAPHSYLPLGNNNYQIGLNLYNRFLSIDIDARTATLHDPGIDDQLLSATNWVDKDNGELWFVSWPMEDTVRRITQPAADVCGTLWKCGQDNQPEKIWSGRTGDAIHQVILSPDKRYAVTCELGLHPARPIPPEGQKIDCRGWAPGKNDGLLPSLIVIIDLLKGREWRLSTTTAAHIEFDPEDPEVFYVSSHNIGLVHGKVGIFGCGSISAYRLEADGPRKLNTFSQPDFHRITTHKVFSHRGRTLIAVTGYPNAIFLIDTNHMKLFKKVILGPGETVLQEAPPISASRIVTALPFLRMEKPCMSARQVDSKKSTFTQKTLYIPMRWKDTAPIGALQDITLQRTVYKHGYSI